MKAEVVGLSAFDLYCGALEMLESDWAENEWADGGSTHGEYCATHEFFLAALLEWWPPKWDEEEVDGG